MVKLENDNIIISFYDRVDNKYVDSGEVPDAEALHKIDITNNLFYFYTDNENTIDLNWNEDFINTKILASHTEVKSKIINNKNVIYTAKSMNDLKEIEKTTKHLNKNIRILEFIDNNISENELQ